MKTPTLQLTRPLLDWLQADSEWSALPLRLRAWLTYQANLGSLNHWLSSKRVAEDTLLPRFPSAGPLNSPAAFPGGQHPIFIIGPWRSGTTAMHELLVRTAGLPTPRQWQCMSATTFMHMRPRGHAAVARPMDDQLVHPASPQEDEFAIMSLGGDSLYRGFWMPHRLLSLRSLLRQDHWVDHEHWGLVWLDFLRGVQLTSIPSSLPMLLKSPNHTFRLRALLDMFPGVRFIWMARPPTELQESNLKMWTQMFALHGLTRPLPGHLETFLDAVWEQSAEALGILLREVPPERWAVVDQRTLKSHPESVIARMSERFGLEVPGMQAPRSATTDAGRSGTTFSDREDLHCTHMPAGNRPQRTLAEAQAEALCRHSV